ncbi:MAG: 30S ribosomal protein S1 [Candidatus Marinimicrobia bacterium]|jgi:small subunit ribosomal protein S1|nr:30S ribosomal protein S1 [Candidatus Neomarinimicrobiota bacterium]MBT3501897.1 30S ribosomal protein S1 [Candidatus Neomarinimicrobiota bacterium]MBT3838577.1 30S ribosomal protein S1 [Candidatus Neomarinimicrobiota bacterium]MBT3999809.1 30S ribosomal protein S1 [Candidatus Neomarinimicrobiota bacterium]MBT4281864.1 30S ribosomal protein S1 [Candidatus Neomarinimicrobiota bacterium]
MFEEQNKEQVVEETLDATVETVVEEASMEVPTTPAETVAEIKDYLNPELFHDIRIVGQSEIDAHKVDQEISADLEKMYSSTLGEITEHSLITGRVVGMNDRDVLIDIGFKSEGIIDRHEFKKDDLPSIGDKVEVFLEFIEDASGNTILSKEKADFMRRWQELRDAFDNQTIITGTIIRRIKGGMIVDLGVVQAFLPGSQVDVRPVQDFDIYLDKEIEIRIVKFNEARKNIVVSHKVILEESLIEQRDALFKELEVGSILEGRVKNITDFGVFVDLGGIDGLLHITDLTWGRVNHPSEVLEMNDSITVKVIEYDEERKRVSLGLKQLVPHPWDDVEIKFPVGNILKGKVVSLTNYGCFIELEPGVEGLIHVSEISWTKHIKNPSEVYKMGDEIEAKVLAIDSEDRKISLGVKQLMPDPWDVIEEKYMVGTVHNCKVQNLTQFGAFAELEEGIDGLVHVSDLSWTKVIKHPKEVVEKGQEIEVRILEVSRENRRISLGYRQLFEDPWPNIVEHYQAGNEVSGEIIRVLDKGIIIQLDLEVEGIIPFGKMSKRDRKALASQYEVGANLSGIVMTVAPDDKKVILFKEELAGTGKSTSATNEVKQFLKNQNTTTGEKLELPQELLDLAIGAEKDGGIVETKEAPVSKTEKEE